MVVVVEALDGRVFDCAVHAFDLTIGPRVLHLCQPMFNAILISDAIKDVAKIIDIAGAIGELDAVIRQHGVDFVGNGLNQIT